ncbi:acyl-CoA thioesterase [Ketobacter alkanivorans]|uniref:Acyl-CoA thioesterase 2 n=1 Tax=Ketobacter alkanivorans TaxID=1917421 RepID=A0A2K9LPU2_9GAMM|nr:acyl-CoA thioesterase II [Ketobacter alkanivorans]AUM14250.1 acyl-CoA thioesterase II [Ketobacter alkanivorans]MCP5018804.1 acyl-CoA thioesterase II [Ketobacter sp.]
MNNLVDELINLLDLETIELNLFRGESRDVGGRSVFGGQVISQSLVAAYRTLEEQRECHSLHAYFLRPGDMQAPIVYEVDRIRDGGSFTTRRVMAIQHGEAIFNMSASFQIVERGFEHQAADLPDVPPPDDLESEYELRLKIAERVHKRVRPVLLQKRPIEMRPVDPLDFLNPQAKAPRKQVWFRASGSMNDDQSMHQALLAYASDFGLLGTGMMPHGLSFIDPNLQAASLDHTLWFHHPLRMDDWLLYDMESPCAMNARSFNRGQIYQHGKLVASVCQEGLMRVRKT